MCFVHRVSWIHWFVYLCCFLQIIKHNMHAEVKYLHNLPHVVFVYGTLKKGQPNHYVMEQFGNCQFFGTGCTKLKYPLIIDTDTNLPFMLDAPGKGQVHNNILVTNSI